MASTRFSDNGRKSSNLIKNHELICHFIIGYLAPLPPYYSGGKEDTSPYILSFLSGSKQTIWDTKYKNEWYLICHLKVLNISFLNRFFKRALVLFCEDFYSKFHFDTCGFWLAKIFGSRFCFVIVTLKSKQLKFSKPCEFESFMKSVYP